MSSNSPSDTEGAVGGRDPTNAELADFIRQVTQEATAEDQQTLSPAIIGHLMNAFLSQRMADLRTKQKARRAAWEAPVKAEVAEREAYKLSMEGLTRRQVLGGSLEDQETLSRISVSWRKGLDKERTKFLFHQVFPIISRRKKTPWHVTFVEIQNLRQVSKLYKDVIDSSLSNSSAHFHEMFDRKPLQNEYTFLKFNSVDKIRVFNRKSVFEYRGSNPFPFRQLYLGNLKEIMSGSNLIYWIELEKLLTHWGHEIWTAFYSFDLATGSIELMYEFLIKYLNLMPNLRELALIGRDSTGGKCEVRECPLTQRIREKPLPELPQLHSLIFVEFTPASLVAAMLEEYRDTLRSVNVEGRGIDKYSGEHVDFGEIMAGGKLQVTNYACWYLDSSRIKHWDYQLPSLNKLRLDYLSVKEGSEVENIFTTVNSCGPSLHQLELKIHFNEEDKPWNLFPAEITLDLPHLEILELTVEGSKVMNFDFLLPLVSLKEFHLRYSHTRSLEPLVEEGTGIIQFGGHDSNFWKLLPDIRVVDMSSMVIGQRHVSQIVFVKDDFRKQQGEQNRR